MAKKTFLTRIFCLFLQSLIFKNSTKLPYILKSIKLKLLMYAVKYLETCLDYLAPPGKFLKIWILVFQPK